MQIVDGLKNLLSGLGGDKDKGASTAFVLNTKTAEELNAMHRSDWLARKVVDIIPNDMTRAWRNWQAKGPQIEKIEAVEKSPLIDARARVNRALQTARLFGGAVIYIGVRSNDPGAIAEPLDPKSVGLGDLQYLHVLSRWEVTCGATVTDVTSEFYGQPSYYEVSGAEGAPARIHPSRMVRFDGAPILDRRAVGGDTWSDSVLQVIYDALQNAGSVQGHVAALIPEAKVDIIHVPGLSTHTKTEAGRQMLTSRFGYANTLKSMMNTVLIDGNGAAGDKAAGEKWEQKQISFAQLPELMRQYLSISAAAADVPVTRLLGESPGGLNSTGDSDLRNYYDNIAARQRTDLQPALARLDEIIIRSALGSRPKAIYYEWAPLWGLSDKERAEIFKLKAEAARTLAGTGGASPPLLPIEALSDALVNTLTEDGSLPGLEAAIEEFGRLAEQEEDEPDETDEGGGLTADGPFVGDARRRRPRHIGKTGKLSHYDPNQPRGGDGRWVTSAARIDRAHALAGVNVIHHEEFAAVSRLSELKRITGRDLRGFNHAVSNQSLSHAKNEHPDLMAEDFRRIPEVVRTGKAKLGEPAKNGSPRVRFDAEVDGVRYGYVAEVRNRQGRLDMVTFFKRG